MAKRKSKTPKFALILRTCNADMSSYGGFVWPRRGRVIAKDWKRDYQCGNGLHGLLWGEGWAGYLSTEKDANWLVVKVLFSDLLHGKGDLRDKCKFRCGVVILVGNRDAAISYLRENGGDGKATVFATLSGGDMSTLSGGKYAVALSGGKARADEMGCILIRKWDGIRWRIYIGYVGENGIKPNVFYKVAGRKLVEA